MKICVAQIQAFKGDLLKNTENHVQWIEVAHTKQANAIFFPELSLTGYEPTLAKQLAMDMEDTRLNVFQNKSDEHQMLIGVGVPTKQEKGICISMVIFRPLIPRTIYFKQYLHADEEPFFVRGENSWKLIETEKKISLAICYELSVTEHAENAHKQGADIYLASVAKSEAGVEKAYERLREIAQSYDMIVLMSNCIGFCDDFEGGGRSTVWNAMGEVVAQLDSKSEGILIFDTETNEIFSSLHPLNS